VSGVHRLRCWVCRAPADRWGPPSTRGAHRWARCPECGARRPKAYPSPLALALLVAALLAALALARSYPGVRVPTRLRGAGEAKPVGARFGGRPGPAPAAGAPSLDALTAPLRSGAAVRGGRSMRGGVPFDGDAIGATVVETDARRSVRWPLRFGGGWGLWLHRRNAREKQRCGFAVQLHQLAAERAEPSGDFVGGGRGRVQGVVGFVELGIDVALDSEHARGVRQTDRGGVSERVDDRVTAYAAEQPALPLAFGAEPFDFGDQDFESATDRARGFAGSAAPAFDVCTRGAGHVATVEAVEAVEVVGLGHGSFPDSAKLGELAVGNVEFGALPFDLHALIGVCGASSTKLDDQPSHDRLERPAVLNGSVAKASDFGFGDRRVGGAAHAYASSDSGAPGDGSILLVRSAVSRYRSLNDRALFQRNGLQFGAGTGVQR
jgi:hypothetical protein